MNEESKREELEAKLKSSVFIVAGGAWQHLWEEGSKSSIGFDSNEVKETPLPSLNQLKSSIKPELLKRFRDEVIFLSPMNREDYIDFSTSIHKSLPNSLKQSFCHKFELGIDSAVSEDLGLRFFERILTSTLVESNQFVKSHENI